MVPALAQEQTRIEALSDDGTFLVEVDWTPSDLGSDHTFTFTFIEPETESVLEDIQYNLVVLKGQDDQMLRRVDQVSTEQKVRFEEMGPHTIVIEDIEGLGEDASFTIQVTPEFPVGVLVPVAAGTVLVILAVRSKSLFSHWSK
jgi:hypothetical protein